jgi:hypothetical protein
VGKLYQRTNAGALGPQITGVPAWVTSNTRSVPKPTYPSLWQRYDTADLTRSGHGLQRSLLTRLPCSHRSCRLCALLLCPSFDLLRSHSEVVYVPLPNDHSAEDGADLYTSFGYAVFDGLAWSANGTGERFSFVARFVDGSLV